MSEYQYYEFQAIDRPLGAAEQAALRAISTRARITSTGFTNTYEWGDLKANPIDLLARYFDVFLYLANWHSRRLAIRLPGRLIDLAELRRYGIAEELVSIQRRGDHVVVDIGVDEVRTADWEDGSGRLAGLAPLRADLIARDHGLFLLLWLIEVERGWPADDAEAPLTGPGHLPAPIAALGDFLGVDADLISVAFGADRTAPSDARASRDRNIETAIRALSEDERVDFLVRLHRGDDPHLGAELRTQCAVKGGEGRGKHLQDKRLTAGEMRHAAGRIGDARKQRAAEQAAIEQRRRAETEAAERKRRLDRLAKHGEAAWREVDDLIDQRNASTYDKATAMLIDLAAVADAAGRRADFDRRVSKLAKQHERKGQLVQRLVKAGLVSQS